MLGGGNAGKIDKLPRKIRLGAARWSGRAWRDRSGQLTIHAALSRPSING
jgi:hypothetical protein